MISNKLYKLAYLKNSALFKTLPACCSLYPTHPSSRAFLAQMMARNFCSAAGATSQTNISEKLSVIKCKVQDSDNQSLSASALPASVASLKALNGVNQINANLRLPSKYSFSTMDPSGLTSLGDQKFPATNNNDAVYLNSFSTRIAENYDDVREAVSLNEPKMCVQAIIEVLSKDTSSDHFYDAKVLDFGSTNAQIGTFLAEQNFTELYAQCGSPAK